MTKLDHYDAITLRLGKIRAISCGLPGVTGDSQLCDYIGTAIFDFATEIQSHADALFESTKEKARTALKGEST